MSIVDPLLRLSNFDYESVRQALIASGWRDKRPDERGPDERKLGEDFANRVRRSEGLRELVRKSPQLNQVQLIMSLYALVPILSVDLPIRHKLVSPRSLRALAKRLEENKLRFEELIGIGARVLSDLAATLCREAEAHEYRKRHPSTPGAKLSVATRLATDLDHALAPIRTADRRRLIADLVTDFIEPKTPEQVRLLLKDFYRREARRRGA